MSTLTGPLKVRRAQGASTSVNPQIIAGGDQANIDLEIAGKGTGAVLISSPLNFKAQVTDTGGAFATPIALTEAQSGRTILVDDAAGLQFTLPAITSSNIGMYFKFLVTVTVTSNSFKVTAAAGDLLNGGINMVDFDAPYAGPQGVFMEPDFTDDLIMTMNGSTTGGKKGTVVEFIAVSATQWFVTGTVGTDGVIATPFA